jgi:hypothetical protein
MPGTRAFVRYALACRVMANTNVDYLAGVRSFVFAISRQAKAYRATPWPGREAAARLFELHDSDSRTFC